MNEFVFSTAASVFMAWCEVKQRDVWAVEKHFSTHSCILTVPYMTQKLNFSEYW